jgi:chemotaxis protein CheX
MFAADPGTLSADEVGDALGELTNMVGGNIKSLLPAPSKLSIPSVAGGESYTVRVPGAVLVERVALVCAAGPLHISIWKV